MRNPQSGAASFPSFPIRRAQASGFDAAAEVAGEPTRNALRAGDRDSPPSCLLEEVDASAVLSHYDVGTSRGLERQPAVGCVRSGKRVTFCTRTLPLRAALTSRGGGLFYDDTSQVPGFSTRKERGLKEGGDGRAAPAQKEPAAGAPIAPCQRPRGGQRMALAATGEAQGGGKWRAAELPRRAKIRFQGHRSPHRDCSPGRHWKPRGGVAA